MTTGAVIARRGSKFRQQRRRVANSLMWVGSVLATLLAVIPLVVVLYYVIIQGLPAINRSFFLEAQTPPTDPGGGVAHAIVGSLIMIGIASCLGLPFGVLGGIYLAEFGNNRFAWWVRFAADVLNGVPSIVVGIFVYAVAVQKTPWHADGHYSALAGGLALGIMMIPTIMRTTEELIRLVPMQLREAALALGDTRWHTVLRVVLTSARAGVITGILLAIARISGETAPLLFTALGNNFMSADVHREMASLPVTIFNFATSPESKWNQQAWAAALVLVSLIFVLSLLARYFTAGKYKAV